MNEKYCYNDSDDRDKEDEYNDSDSDKDDEYRDSDSDKDDEYSTVTDMSGRRTTSTLIVIATQSTLIINVTIYRLTMIDPLNPSSRRNTENIKNLTTCYTTIQL